MSGGDSSSEPNLDAAYALETPEDNRRLYARWAETYESGFIEESGYVYHRNVAAVYARGRTDAAAGSASVGTGAVLDVGCGTGVVGVELRKLGIAVVDGIDISPQMLAKAAEKHDDRGPVYRHLGEADLTAEPVLPAEDYSGVISAGAFTHGHLGPEPLARLVGMTAPGTRFTIGVNEAHFAEHGFDRQLRELEQADRIGPVELIRVAIYEAADPADPDGSAQVAEFTVR